MELFRNGQVNEAIEAFSDLHHVYQSQGDLVKADEMANNLAVARLDLNQAEEAIKLVEATPERFLSADQPVLAAQAYGNLGAAFAAADQIEEAEDAYRQSKPPSAETTAEDASPETRPPERGC